MRERTRGRGQLGLGPASTYPRARLGLGMFRLALVLACSLSANCTVLTSILSSDLADASVEDGDADLPGDGPDAGGGSMDAGPACPPNYSETAGTCHRVSEGGLGWLLAEADCELDGQGAHLVIIDDALEEAAVPDGSWIGLYEFDGNGNFRTVTNQPPPFAPWAAEEPVAGPGFCVDKRAEGWHDDNCLIAKPYVCEFDGVPAETPYLP